MRIGVLAVQGAFAEHIEKLSELGVKSFEIRQQKDINGSFDGLILPGGESTTMRKLLTELDLIEPLRKCIQNGMPVLGTCAGMILLAGEISGGEASCFGTFDITVKRNAYGRQLGSFHYEGEIKGIGNFPLEFIRAPYVEAVSNDDVEILATVDDKIVAVRYKNQIACAFHPELTDDNRMHKLFLDLIK